MKKTIFFLSCFSLFFLSGCNTVDRVLSHAAISGDNLSTNSSSEIPKEAIESFINQTRNCETIKDRKVFITYAVLGTGVSDSGNILYYIITSGMEYYIDHRGNLSSSCAFSHIPMKFEITKEDNNEISNNQQKSTYKLVKAYLRRDEMEYAQSMQDLFPPNIFKTFQESTYSLLDRKTLEQEAEQFFGVTIRTGKNFECEFCDKKRYFSKDYYVYDGGEQKNVESYVLKKTTTSTKDNGNAFVSFSSGGLYEAYGGITGNRIFGNTKNTILIKTNGNIERHIIIKQTKSQLDF